MSESRINLIAIAVAAVSMFVIQSMTDYDAYPGFTDWRAIAVDLALFGCICLVAHLILSQFFGAKSDAAQES